MEFVFAVFFFLYNLLSHHTRLQRWQAKDVISVSNFIV